MNNIFQSPDQIELDKCNLYALINNTTDLMWSVDTDYRLISSNTPFSELVKLLSGKTISKGDSVLVHEFGEEQLAKYRQFYDWAFAGETFTELEYTRLPYEIWNEISFYPIRRNGIVIGTACHAHDITKRKIAERFAKESEYRFRSLVEFSSDGITVSSETGRILYVSDSVTNILGYEKDELLQMDLSAILHPQSFAAKTGLMEKVLSSPGTPVKGIERKLQHKNGNWCWVESTITNMLHDPAINGIIENFRDITERKLAENKIIHLNRLYVFLSQINKTIVRVANEKTLFKEACRIGVEYGKFKAAWIGEIDTENKIINLVDQCGFADEDALLFSNIPYKDHGTTGYVLRTGGYYISNNVADDPKLIAWKSFASTRGYRSCMVLPLKKFGKITGTFNLFSEETDFFNEQEAALLVGAAEDISYALGVFEKDRERKYFENKIKHSERRLTQAQEIAHFGGWELDFATGVGVWSEEACRIYGLSVNDNKHPYEVWLSFIHPDDRDYVLKITRESEATYSNSNMYHRIIRPDGTVRYINSIAHFEFNAEGAPVALYGVAHDITDQVTNSNQLKVQNKTLQDIAWIQSHKVRGPLATILGLTELYLSKYSEDQSDEIIEGIRTSSIRLDNVIREIVGKTSIAEVTGVL